MMRTFVVLGIVLTVGSCAASRPPRLQSPGSGRRLNGLDPDYAVDRRSACSRRHLRGWLADAETGQPLAGARVCLPGWTPADGTCRTESITDDDGAFAVADAHVGADHQLSIEYNGARCAMMLTGCDEIMDIQLRLASCSR